MCFFDIGIVTVGPQDAMIIAGVGYGDTPQLITGGGWALICPCIHSVTKLTLNTLTIEVVSPNVYTSQGVGISVVGIAQVPKNTKLSLSS